MATDKLRACLYAAARVRKAVASNGSMHRNDKVYVYTQLKLIDDIINKELQLELFSAAQRSS